MFYLYLFLAFAIAFIFLFIFALMQAAGRADEISQQIYEEEMRKKEQAEDNKQ